ncbi:MAG: hypothetical protein WKF59_03650 [Chitinophagaceae bacterium]
MWGNKGFNMFSKEGYSVSRDFYSPDYNRFTPAIDFTDNRPTLYWSPDLKPG